MPVEEAEEEEEREVRPGLEGTLLEVFSLFRTGREEGAGGRSVDEACWWSLGVGCECGWWRRGGLLCEFMAVGRGEIG